MLCILTPLRCAGVHRVRGGALNEAISWLAPQPPARAVAAWYQASTERRAFVARLLAQLLDAAPELMPPALLPAVCAALMRVEAAPVAAPGHGGAAGGGDEGGGDAGAAGGGEEPLAPDLERARAGAKALLAKHRGCLPLWGAYAQLEAAAKQQKAARRVYNAALAAAAAAAAGDGAASATGFAGADAAPLALAAAEAELGRGGADARPRALHVLVWLGAGGPFTPYAPPTKVRLPEP